MIEKVNGSKYGLQTGIFTNSLQKGFYAYENLHVVLLSLASRENSSSCADMNREAWY